VRPGAYRSTVDVRWYGPSPRRYRDPVAVVETSDPGSVDAALSRADEALASGYSIAGYIAYEAGLAACGVRPPAATPELPLIALGVFNAAHPLDAPCVAGPLPLAGPLVAQVDRERYAADLDAIAAALREGDAYQVNYTVPFAYRDPADQFARFESLRRRAKVPYAAFVRHRGRALVSLSPELFFELDGDVVRAKPMKGTTAPHEGGGLGDGKNRAEHVMIVDLLRNDLSRLCSRVEVPALFAVESYPSFTTMTSTIEGTLERGRTFGDVVRALFPCGSITGAPKRAAMGAIARLERGARFVAMGTIGYCDAPRRGCWNVAIRTAVVDETTARGELRVGGGIVADSACAAEWAEILLKRRAFEERPPPGLIETMRVTPRGTIVREAAHRARLERSAFALGLPLDAEALEAALRRAAALPRAADALLRLLLEPAGTIRTSERALEATTAPARLCVAPVRIDGADPARRHKTTLRAPYDAALRYAREEGCFDALLLDEFDRIADGARTTVFVERDGLLLTPPLEHGAVAGVLRAELLAGGRAREATLRPQDLRGVRVFVGNSARGLVPAALLELVVR
jgi:para-aminobenzoate synthetase/4-amino-4-deoxychorismate lyase